MRTVGIFSLLIAGVACAMAAAPPAAHVSRSSVIHLEAPADEVFPLFGPLAEKKWAGHDWSPDFLSPAGGADVEGAVFTTGEDRHAIWVLTAFDLRALRAAYVQVTPGKAVTQLDIGLTREGPERTSARITYTWTGLSEDGNRFVEHHGQLFDKMMSEWEGVMNVYLKGVRRK